MNCACGTEIEPDSVDRIDGYDAGTPPMTIIGNGNVCIDCDEFTCKRCFDEFEKLGTEFADRSLCIACNTMSVGQRLAQIILDSRAAAARLRSAA